MGLTWEQVALGIDIKNESLAAIQHKKDVAKMQLDEADAASKYKLGLTLIAYPFLGPMAPVVGDLVGEYIADVQHPWEDMELDPGKFFKTEDISWQDDVDEMASDQTLSQALNAATSLAKGYISAGGLDEKFRGDWDDWTSWNTGGAEGGEWTIFGDETGVWEAGAGLFKNLGSIGETLGYWKGFTSNDEEEEDGE